MNKPKIIILSSSEGHQPADMIRTLLSHNPSLRHLGTECVLWWERFMGENEFSAFDVLEKMAEEYNFAIVLFTQDDLTESRGVEKASPRDNLVFELGFFIGALGRERTMLLIERGNIKIPSDLHGVMPEALDFPPKCGTTQLWEPRPLMDKLGPVCGKIAMKLQRIRWNLPSKTGYPPMLRKLRDNWIPYTGREKHDDFKLFTFCGISDKIEPREIWNDSTNLEQVYYLWANPSKGSWIHAEMVKNTEQNDQLIRLTFSNKENGYPCNVAIRFAGQGLVATKNGEQFKALQFKARIPSNSDDLYKAEKPTRDNAVALSKVGINIRVVDALTTHWEYCRGLKSGEYNILSLTKGNKWEKFEIPLESYHCWTVFESDGNYLYHSNRPDFSQIIAVIIEIGDPDGNRVGKGAGIVELKDFSAIL